MLAGSHSTVADERERLFDFMQQAGSSIAPACIAAAAAIADAFSFDESSESMSKSSKIGVLPRTQTSRKIPADDSASIFDRCQKTVEVNNGNDGENDEGASRASASVGGALMRGCIRSKYQPTNPAACLSSQVATSFGVQRRRQQ